MNHFERDAQIEGHQNARPSGGSITEALGDHLSQGPDQDKSD